MSRYIDAEWLTGELRALPLRCGRMIINAIINHAPSIDIVHCGECKAYDSECEWCGDLGLEMKPDDFCSYGEREGE